MAYKDQFRTINRSEPDDIISFFSTYGTHYVSEYEQGDFIFQIFVYEKPMFDEISGKFPDDSTHRFGWKAVYFRYYTEPRHQLVDGTTVGYSKYVGKILASSGDSKFNPIRPLLFDDIYNLRSILMFLTDSNIAIQTENMTALIKKKVVLKSIADEIFCCDEEGSALKEDWYNILKGALFQKYGSHSSPGFEQISESTPLSFYNSFNPDIVTSIASPYTSIVQAKFNLDDLKILSPDFVSDLFIFADVIEIPENSKIHLPASDNVYLICREFRSHSVGSSVPEITVGSIESNVNFKLVASSFQGAMKLVLVSSTKTSSYTYIGESVLKTTSSATETNIVTEPTLELKLPTRSLVPKLYSDTNGEFINTWLARSFLNGLELLTVTIENVYSLRVGNTVQTAKKSLDWIIEILKSARNENTITTELESVLSRALLIQNLYPKSEKPLLIVPALTFPQYKVLYESLLREVKLYEDKLTGISNEISQRKMTETLIDNQNKLNNNVLETGRFLVGEAKSEALYFDDVSIVYNQLKSKKQSELDQEITKMRDLATEVNAYSDSVRQVGDVFIEKLKYTQDLLKIGIVVDTVSTVAEMFKGGIKKPNPKALGNVKNIAQKVIAIKRLADVIEGMYESLDDLQDKLRESNEDMLILPDMSAYNSKFPTLLDWEDFQNDVDTYTHPATLDCCGPESAAFKAEVGKLTTRGKLFLVLLRRVSELQYEILVNKLNADVAKKQKDRLDDLSNYLDLQSLPGANFQANTVNLFEVGNILQSRANNVRIQLARTYLTMDAALQFYYLKQATPLTGYDTISIQSAASRQIAESITAFEQFPSSPHDLQKPVVYEIPLVRISELTSKNGYRYTLPLTAIEFQDYVRVRIREIRVTIDSIKSAGTDAIYIESEYFGDKCRDRDLNRNEKVFSTTSKEYRYVYNYTDGSVLFGNSISSDVRDKYTMMTPFGDWIFKIPKVNSTNLNVDVQYSSQVTTLRIEFYLNVILNPATRFARMQAATCTTDGLSCLKEKITNKTITGNFDAVMALNAKKINDLWEQKYLYQNISGAFMTDIATDWVIITDFPYAFTLYGRITAQVGPPRISFVANNPKTIKLAMTLYDTLYERKQKMYGTNQEIFYPSSKYNTTFTINSINDITKIQGSVTSQKVVVVDMTSSLVSLNVPNLTSSETISLDANLKQQFRQINSSSYELGTVDYNSQLTPHSLQPREFYFTTSGPTSTSNPYGTLFLCILTGFSDQNSPDDDPEVCEISTLLIQSDPVIPSGYTAALYISSEVIFDIIKNAATSGLGVTTSITRVNANERFSAKKVIVPGSTTTVNFHVSYTVAPTCTGGKYVSNLPINVPASNIELKPTGSGKLIFSWSARWSSSLVYYEDNWGGLSCSAIKETTSASFDFDTTGEALPSVDSNGIISFPALSYTNTGVGSDAEWSFLANNYGRQAAADAVGGTLQNRIKSIRVNINPISIFALTNLIFPEAKVVDPKKVYLFGDLVILGDVVKDYNPTPTGLSG